MSRVPSPSERWFRALLHLYPRDFREEFGGDVVATYVARARDARQRGGSVAVVGIWLRAFVDALWNGPAERLRPAAGWRRSGNWGRDSELAIRRLVRAPVFALTMVATLTVGLGAFAVVCTAVDKVLLEPLPYERPDDLYYVWRNYTWFEFGRGWAGGTDVAALQEAGGVIADAAATRGERATLATSAEAEPREVRLLAASANLFDLLGVQPAIGRGFAVDEAGPDRAQLVVLTHALWRTLGGDPALIGRELFLNGVSWTVIGVMAPDFRFSPNASIGAPQPVDAYVPLDVDLAQTNPNAGSYAALIRAVPGATAAAVEAQVAAVGAAIDARDFDSRGVQLWSVGMRPDLVEPIRPALVVLGAAGAFLVVVLLVNLATLLLARAAQREQEFAVSRALGANPFALARATMFEAGLLGLIGGAGAVFAALWGTRVLVALAPLDLPRREAIAVDWGIAATVVATGLAVGLLAGVAPAVWAAKTRLSSLMSAANVRGGGARGRMRRGMVVVQVALSLVLLSAGGLVIRSFERLLRTDPGFEPAGVLTVRVPVPAAQYGTVEAVNALHDRLHRELAALPGVTVVGGASGLPLRSGASQTSTAFPGAPGNTGDPDHDQPLSDWLRVRAGYFEALGIQVLAGRAFEGEAQPGVLETVIDRTLAQKFFPSSEAVGSYMTLGADSARIIGVVEHARMSDIRQDGIGQFYLRNEIVNTVPSLSWVLRTGRTPSALIPEARAAIRRVDPGLALSEILSMEEIVSDALRQQRTTAVLVGGFSVGALLLAAMGLFGVVSGSVTRRRHELAVRMALGANHGSALRLVMKEGAMLIGIGLLVGVPGVWLGGRVVQGVLFGVRASDPATLAVVAAGLAAVALGACYLPARRVLRIEPAGLLRRE
jgi:putative ABC transport system permease protein